ncbi:MAG: acyl-CoA dehydrogenase family protein, partial [Actinomycetota bacterium]
VDCMDFRLPADDDPRRLAVREWLARNPNPTGRRLAEAGYVVAHWPAPWGLSADPEHQLIVDDELRRAKVRGPDNPIGIGWAGPTIAYAGSAEQKDRYLMPLLSGEEYWCQLFSEPVAGSDLAALGTRAVRDGDEWVVNGQKICTSGAQIAKFGILIARTDPTVAKHRGISYFICPMDLAGIEIRPITEMTGGQMFNEVFFTDVRIPAANLVGAENDGWRLTKVTLANERVSLSTGGVLWGSGPTGLDVVDLIRSTGPVTDPRLRQRIAAVYTEHTILDLIRLRTLTARLQGRQPGPEASVRKLLADEHGQHVMALARDCIGAWGLLRRVGTDTSASGGLGALDQETGLGGLMHPGWYDGFMFAPALTIGGGTWAVQRNIIGERVLGLPAEPDPTAGQPWGHSPGSRREGYLRSSLRRRPPMRASQTATATITAPEAMIKTGARPSPGKKWVMAHGTFTSRPADPLSDISTRPGMVPRAIRPTAVTRPKMVAIATD